MKLSNGQKLALNKLLEWYKKPDKKQSITLGGYAGTGKTTLIAIFRKEISELNKKKKIKVGFCSYTGKAAQNLKLTLTPDSLSVNLRF